VNDTVAYYRSNLEVQSRFGGIFLNTGIQYQINTPKAAIIRIGVYANLQQKLDARQSTINETFATDGTGSYVTIDSVSKTNDVKGEVIIPATFGTGFTYLTSKRHWLLGADFEYTAWNGYRYYNDKDIVANSWIVKFGAEFNPLALKQSNAKFFNRVKYRAGFYYGPDYIKLGKTRNQYAVTAGASFPLTSPRTFGRGDYVSLNTSIEAGGRGNKQSIGLRENFVRINFGISMNARWFQKRKYD